MHVRNKNDTSNWKRGKMIVYGKWKRWDKKGQHLSDIAVGDIGQPQCHKCTKKQKETLWKREKKDICDIEVDQCHQPQCQPSAVGGGFSGLLMRCN